MDGGDYGDGGGGGGGGGFIAGAGQSPPGAGGGGGRGGYKITDKSKAIMPLTVKLLDGASQSTPTDPWVIDKVELSFGRIVGRLLDMTDDSSTFRFLVHDGTGSIQFTHYVEQGEAWSLKRGSLELGKYVDVVFEVKSNAAKDCPPLTFSTVTDSNRITRHLLEVVYGHLYNTRGELVPVGGGGGAGSGASPGGMAGGGLGGMQGGGLGVGGDGGREAGMGSEINAVLGIYKECEDEDGTALQDAIVKGKQRGLSEKAVRDATVSLQMDGLIYSTMDESHYRAT